MLLRIDDFDDERQTLGEHFDALGMDLMAVAEPGYALENRRAGQTLGAEHLEYLPVQRPVTWCPWLTQEDTHQDLLPLDTAHHPPPSGTGCDVRRSDARIAAGKLRSTLRAGASATSPRPQMDVSRGACSSAVTVDPRSGGASPPGPSTRSMMHSAFPLPTRQGTHLPQLALAKNDATLAAKFRGGARGDRAAPEIIAQLEIRVVEQQAQIQALQARVAEFDERLRENSRISSRPPFVRYVGVSRPAERAPSGRAPR